MRKNSKVVAILPAYNAQKTIGLVLNNLPKGVFSDIIVSDDCSVDKTMIYAARMRNITLIQTPRNLGYGGNVKYCLSTALEKGADIVVEIHPDGEYGMDGIIPALEQVKKGSYLVLGNRFLAQLNGMYWWKVFGTKLLSFLDNIALGTRVPDVHQGFRVYTRKLLESVPYRRGVNDYLFSFQIIAQAVRFGLRIASVPVSSRYTGTKRGARIGASIRYALGTFSVIIQFWMSKLGFPVALFAKNDDKVLPVCPTCRNWYLVYKVFDQKEGNTYYCCGCGNGFLHPVPRDVSAWYRQEYYISSSVEGILKKWVYQYFQSRRVLWVKQYRKRGTVIDVGSGEGIFGKNLGYNYSVLDIEAPFARVVNDKVLKTDFLSWKPKSLADAAVFWESLEHLNDPKAYLIHAQMILKPGGLLFIEYPRTNSLESRLFGKRWYHLDLPRHQSQLTDEGILYVLRSSGFLTIHKSGIWAPEYAVVGFAASLMGLTANDLDRKSQNLLSFIVFVPMLMVSCLIEGILFLCDQSPIGLIIAKKQQ